jgi:stringent starvation protein B
MSIPTSGENTGTSTRPYLLRALHDWCTDNGFTPYIAVFVDSRVQVPMEYVKNNEIVLNVGFEATSGLKLGNEWIEFRARFGGVPRDIVVPVDHVVAIYARENGQGMAFPVPSASGADNVVAPVAGAAPAAPPAAGRAPPRSGLRLATREGHETPEDGADAQTPPEPPPPASPSPAGPPRPALKRIK